MALFNFKKISLFFLFLSTCILNVSIVYANTQPSAQNVTVTTNTFASCLSAASTNVQLALNSIDVCLGNDSPNFIESITRSGNNVSLVNDSTSPGNSYYYGTNASGTKGFFTIPITGVTSVATSAPITGGTITSTGTIGITQAGSSGNGYLSSTDWNTFNGKQANLSLVAGTYTGGDWCSYTSSGTVLNCNNAVPQINLSLAPGSYVNGDACTYASSGTLINCNTAITSGTVTSVGVSSPNSTLTIGSSPVTSSGTITSDLNLSHTNNWLADQEFSKNIGIGTTITSAGAALTVMNGNVGIGTWVPAANFNVIGSNSSQFAVGGTSALNSLTLHVLTVAGAGGGGAATAAGGGRGAGGAGGYIDDSGYVVTNSNSISVTVGASGAGAATGTNNAGSNGGNSVFGTDTAIGGGAGAGNGANPGNGGSGGGCSGGSACAGGTGTAGQGNTGGASGASGDQGGGGGGATAIGGQGGAANGGAGGAGYTSTISGSSQTYACGGGGGAYFPDGGSGGTAGCSSAGVGGNGSSGASATANTGSGGGGGGGGNGSNTAGGNGATGIVIISYPTQSIDGTGGTITHSGGNTIHTFTSSGTFSPPALFNATPTILFQSGTSTLSSIQSKGATNSLVITNNSVASIILDSNGNVGIGSSVPGQVLDVAGNIRTIGTNQHIFGSDNANYLSNSASSSGDLTFNTNSLERMRIGNGGGVGIGTTKTTTAGLSVMNGNVGIGTWVPSAELDVTGSINNAPQGNVGSGGSAAIGGFQNFNIQTMNDNITAGGGTAGQQAFNAIQEPFLNATNAITTNNIDSMYINGPPLLGTNQTGVIGAGLYIDSGNQANNFSGGTYTDSYGLYVANSNSNTTNSQNAAFFGGSVEIENLIGSAYVAPDPTAVLTVRGGSLYVVPLAGSVNTSISGTAIHLAPKAEGKYLYYLTSTSNTLTSNTITNLNALPTVVNNITTNISGPTDLCLGTNVLFVTNATSGTLSAYNITNPGLITAYSNPLGGFTTPEACAVSGNYVFVTDAGTNTLYSIDESKPSNPIIVSSITTNLSSPQGLSVNKNNIYVASQGNSKLCSFSFSPSGILTSLSSVSTSLSTPVDVSTSNGVAYVSDTTNGLISFKIVNPSSMSKITSVNTPFTGAIQSIPAGQFLYVLGFGGLFAYQFDVSTSTYSLLSSTGVGSSTFPAYGLAAIGNNAYVCGKGLIGYFLGSSIKTASIASGLDQTGTLDVQDSATVNNNLLVNGGFNVGANEMINGSSSIANNLYVGNNGGNVGIGTITPMGALTVMNGNVGIGTWVPSGLLQVGKSCVSEPSCHTSTGAEGCCSGGLSAVCGTCTVITS